MSSVYFQTKLWKVILLGVILVSGWGFSMAVSFYAGYMYMGYKVQKAIDQYSKELDEYLQQQPSESESMKADPSDI